MSFLLGTVKGSDGLIVFISADHPAFEHSEVTTIRKCGKAVTTAKVLIGDEIIELEDVAEDIGPIDVTSMGALSIDAYLQQKFAIDAYLQQKKDLGSSDDEDKKKKEKESEEIKRLRAELERSQVALEELKKKQEEDKITKVILCDQEFFLKEDLSQKWEGRRGVIRVDVEEEDFLIASPIGETIDGKILLLPVDDAPMLIDKKKYEEVWWKDDGVCFDDFIDLVQHWKDEEIGDLLIKAKQLIITTSATTMKFIKLPKNRFSSGEMKQLHFMLSAMKQLHDWKLFTNHEDTKAYATAQLVMALKYRGSYDHYNSVEYTDGDESDEESDNSSTSSSDDEDSNDESSKYFQLRFKFEAMPDPTVREYTRLFCKMYDRLPEVIVKNILGHIIAFYSTN